MKRYILLAVVILICPVVVLAQANDSTTVKTFTENIPFLDGELTTQGFVEAMYKLAIALASIIVVIRLMMAGAKYMLSEVVSNKGQAKEDIKNALFGLLIILGAVLILGTINPKLVGVSFINNGAPLNIQDPDTVDQIGFKPGDNFSGADIAARCGEGNLSGAPQEECVKNNEDALLRSCKHNGGSKLDWEFDPDANWGGYSYYSYTCVQ
ncbi:hypothetical protein A2837_03035 [Candidatus Kaiserbacteria bacterium RIFCSPHIGHO2_01_FULL_46_22]|uniref:DUF5671 domain-containing protein n=1 Tax=Candidatus Kaiserbacteria bacterium RIFCSPHIGHO2_01_FULL_46_22 TaxID=1798475 RepID=A0A1F6BX04_9BACT|nr:MAG: hypothetical protein A2837_03035 [Candidatus Kaiserbacteria bacterium RIFCSPHIGHO2_01_FULL_46_22]